jgi:hypothetical protein
MSTCTPLRRFRRVPKSTIVLAALAVVALVVAHLVQGSKPRFVHIGNHRSIPVDQTHRNDYARTALWIAAALMFGFGLYRWNAASEAPADESDAHPRAFGDSIVDARTQVDPGIGIRPVDMSRDR